MSELVIRLKAVRKQVRLLIQERDALREQVDKLEADAQQKHREMEVLAARVVEMERENEVLRMARSLDTGEGREEAKQRIDELVDEIDRCLALIKA